MTIAVLGATFNTNAPSLLVVVCSFVANFETTNAPIIGSLVSLSSTTPLHIVCEKTLLEICNNSNINKNLAYFILIRISFAKVHTLSKRNNT